MGRLDSAPRCDKGKGRASSPLFIRDDSDLDMAGFADSGEADDDDEDNDDDNEDNDDDNEDNDEGEGEDEDGAVGGGGGDGCFVDSAPYTFFCFFLLLKWTCSFA